MTGEVSVHVSANFDRWIAGFATAGTEIDVVGERMWKAANDVFFDRSQQYVHVLTGRLKTSGTKDVTASDGNLEAVIMYDTPYAEVEELRGGSHAYLTRAWEATGAMFEAAMEDSWTAVVATWR